MNKPKKKEKGKAQFIEKRKKDAWAYILKYYTDNGYMPTLREIGESAFQDHLTPEGVKYILKGLARDNKIELIPRKPRGIVLKGGGK